MPGASLRASSTRTPSRHRQNNIENQIFELITIRKPRSGNMCIGNAVFYYMRSLQALAAKAGVGLDEDRRIIAGDDAGE